MSILYKAQDLHFSYKGEAGQDIKVLHGASFTIPEASFSCLVGPSGTGKTTLLNLLGLIEQPQSGTLFLKDYDLKNLTESEREKIRLKEIGFIFQAFYLIPTLTVYENAAYFMPLMGLTASETRERVNYYLKVLGILDLKDRKPQEISGGQRQRVAIARAIVKKPTLILADEPTANLDSETAETIIAAFKDLQKNENVSFLFSTHDDRLLRYSESLYSIEKGLIVKGAP